MMCLAIHWFSLPPPCPPSASCSPSCSPIRSTMRGWQNLSWIHSQVEKAVILFYLGLAAAICGTVGLVSSFGRMMKSIIFWSKKMSNNVKREQRHQRVWTQRVQEYNYAGNIGQASACSAGLGMDSHNPHWHSRPRPTGDHRSQMCPRSLHHRRIHFHILSTAWFGRSSSNLRQEWPLSEASRSYLPTPFRSSSSWSWSLAASLKASSSTTNC